MNKTLANLLEEAICNISNIEAGETFIINDLFERSKWKAIPAHLRVKLGIIFSREISKREDVKILPKTKGSRRIYEKIETSIQVNNNIINCGCMDTEGNRPIFRKDKQEFCSVCLNKIDISDGEIYTIDKNSCSHKDDLGEDAWKTYDNLDYSYCGICGITHADHLLALKGMRYKEQSTVEKETLGKPFKVLCCKASIVTEDGFIGTPITKDLVSTILTRIVEKINKDNENPIAIEVKEYEYIFTDRGITSTKNVISIDSSNNIFAEEESYIKNIRLAFYELRRELDMNMLQMEFYYDEGYLSYI